VVVLTEALQGCEIALCFLLWAIIIHPVVERVYLERATIFSYFLNIPHAALLRLATKSITVEEQDDDEEDDEDSETEEFQKAQERHEKMEEARRRGKKPNPLNLTPLDTTAVDIQDVMSTTPRDDQPQDDNHLWQQLVTKSVNFLQNGFNKSSVNIRSGDEFDATALESADAADTKGTDAHEQRREERRLRHQQRQQERARSLKTSFVKRISFGAPMGLAMALLLTALFLTIQYISSSMSASRDIVPHTERVYHVERVRFYALELVLLQWNHDTLGGARDRLLKAVDDLIESHEENLVSARRTDEHADLLFSPKCLRENAADCRTPDDPYYPYVMMGVASLISRYAEEAKWLAKDSEQALTQDNKAWLFINEMATTDLYDGTTRAVDIDHDEQRDLKYWDTVGQSAVFVSIFVDLVLFFVFIYKPFVRQADCEATRSAMMLSLLPDYVNLEALRKN